MQRANPYADFGGVVTGARFVGRERELRMIASRVFGGGSFGSLAVVGLPRVGKSSLVAEAIGRAEADSSGLRTAVVQLNVGEFDSISDMFRRLVEELYECVGGGEPCSDEIQHRVSEVLSERVVDFGRVRRVFKSFRTAGVRPVCVLDEFDAGRRLFAEAPQCFHWLRELCSNPQFKAAVIIVAKRRLQDVARLAGHDSEYWQNVLMMSVLGAFSASDTASFFTKLDSEGVSIDQECRDSVRHICGSVPFLLDCFAYQSWERVRCGLLVDRDWVWQTCNELASTYVEQIIPILVDSSLLEKAVQIFVGPQRDVTSDDVRVLQELGVVRVDGVRIRPFVPALEDQLRSMADQVDVWPLWRQAERTLRVGLESQLEVVYGTEWPAKLIADKPKLKDVVVRCQEHHDRDVGRGTSSDTSTSLLSYTYPMELYAFMCADWNRLGRTLLGGDRHEWSIKFSALAQIRTPLAHNREEVVSRSQRVYAEGVCHDILERAGKWDALRE